MSKFDSCQEWLIQPPTKPASPPSNLPMNTPSATAANAIGRESLAPYSVRDKRLNR